MSQEIPNEPDHGLLVRGVLIKKLDQAAHKPVTLILAPAGAGKSVLLRQWSDSHTDHTPLLMHLRRRDASVAEFLSHLLQLAPSLSAISGPGQEPASRLHSVLSGLPAGTTLVLDNFEHINHGPMLDVLRDLLEEFPEDLHLVLSGRSVPDLALSRLDLGGLVARIGSDDLRLDSGDITALTRLSSGHPLNDRQANALGTRTEGWIAGVIYGLQSIEANGNKGLSGFGGSSPAVAQYLEDEVMGHLSSRDEQLLEKLSVCDRFSGPLADALLNVSGSAQSLDRLSRQQLFLVPIASQAGWYRLHSMVQQFLYGRLSKQDPDQVTRLHRQAVGWHRQRGNYDSALSHAIASGDNLLTLSVLEESVGYWCREGYFGKVVEWARRFPDQDMLSVPGLVVPLIRAHTLARRFSRAQRYVDLIKQNLAHGTRLCDDITLRYLELKLELFQDDTDFRKRKDLEDFLEHARDHWIYPFALAVSAYHHAQNARFDLALRHAQNAREALLSTGQNFLASYMDRIIAMCNRNTGRITHVIRDIREAYESTPESSPAHHLYSAGMVVMLYEQNREQEAADICSEVLPVLDQTSATEAVTAVYLVGSRVYRSCGNQTAARRLLDQLASVLYTGNYERFVSQLTCETIRQQLADGQKDQMERFREVRRLRELLEAGEWDKPQPYTETWERDGIATAYWLIQHQRYSTARRVLKVIANVLEQVGIINRLIVVRALLITVTDHDQGREAAIDELQPLIADVTLIGITRSVYDEAPGFGAILDQAGKQGRVLIPDVYRRMFDHFLQSDEQETLPNPASVLTDKELEIFGQLLRGLTNAEISQATGTTVATTKWHLKNIYSKLKVSNRTEAILKAPRDLTTTR
jgi:LuxR family maltose regulon positive regulatory protein